MKSFEYQFLDWLRSKPAEDTYDYTDPEGCAVCQFLQESGYASSPEVIPNLWKERGGTEWRSFPDAMEGAANPPTTSRSTFGAAADRLEKLLAR